MKVESKEKVRPVLPAPLIPSDVQNEFDKMAMRLGLWEFRTVLLHGLSQPVRLRNPVYGDLFLDAMESHPAEVAQLILFLHGRSAKTRRISLPEFIEQNPGMMNTPAGDVLSAFGEGVTPEAVRAAKNAVSKRRGGLRSPRKPKKTR